MWSKAAPSHADTAILQTPFARTIVALQCCRRKTRKREEKKQSRFQPLALVAALEDVVRTFIIQVVGELIQSQISSLGGRVQVCSRFKRCLDCSITTSPVPGQMDTGGRHLLEKHDQSGS